MNCHFLAVVIRLTFTKAKTTSSVFGLLVFVTAVLIVLIFGCAQNGYAPGPGLSFIYAADAGSNPGVDGYLITPGSGALTLVSGSPFPASTIPFGIAVEPSAHFLYVADQGVTNHGVYAYSINSRTGALSKIVGSPFPASDHPINVLVDPTGRFVYVNDIGTIPGIYGYTINSSSGALIPMSVSPFTGDPTPNRMTMDPLGRFVIVSDNTGGASTGLYVYKINPNSGFLTLAYGPALTSTQPRGLIVDPSGQFVYESDGGSPSGIYAYRIDAVSGALTAISALPFSNGSNFDQQLTIVGQYLFTTYGQTGVNAFSINSSTGTLSQVAGAPFSSGTSVFGITSDPSGQYIYVGNDNVTAYGIYGSVLNAATGKLTSISGSPFPAGTSDDYITSVRIPQPRYP